MKAVFIILGLTILGLLILFIVYAKVFLRSNKPSKMFKIIYTKKQERVKNKLIEELSEFEQKDSKNIYISSTDGLKLHGKYYYLNEDNPIIIDFHGYKGNIKDHLAIRKIANDNNYNLLLVEERAHGESEGKTITFGIKERRDVQSWTNYIANKYPKNKIILYGTSMGAASILMASDLALPKNVVGIIADSPFDDPQTVINEILKIKKYPVKLTSKLIHIAGIIFGNFDLKYHNAHKSIKKTNIPILMFHSKDDKVIPYKISEKLYKEEKYKIELHIFENADHCLICYEEQEKYQEIITKFIRKVTK